LIARWLTGCVLLVVFTAGCSGSGNPTAGGTTAEAQSTGVASGTGPSPQPEPFVVSGSGRTRRVIEIPSTFEPLVLVASFRAGDLLSVEVKGPGFQRLEGEQGGFVFDDAGTGETATPGIEPGSYRLGVKGTKGRWALTFSGPNPEVAPIELPEAIQGSGDLVGKLHLAKATAMTWEMASNGPFVSGHLLGYGDAAGAEQFLGILQGGFIFEPGKSGLRTDEVLPAGNYLIIVDGDSDWAFDFSSVE